jgi:hypothetical protein
VDCCWVVVAAAEVAGIVVDCVVTTPVVAVTHVPVQLLPIHCIGGIYVLLAHHSPELAFRLMFGFYESLCNFTQQKLCC